MRVYPSTIGIILALVVLFYPHMEEPMIAGLFGIMMVLLIVMDNLLEESREDRRYLREKLQWNAFQRAVNDSPMYVFESMNLPSAVYGSAVHAPTAFTAMVEDMDEDAVEDVEHAVCEANDEATSEVHKEDQQKPKDSTERQE